MSQGIILYFSVSVVTHFSIVLGMAILVTVGHSVYSTMRNDKISHFTALIFKQQIRYFLIIIIIAILTGSLQLIVPPKAADFFHRAALLIDITGPLFVLALTMRRIQVAKRATGAQPSPS